jgi:uncharacterized lipoprotein YddW (UPF0748 family)
MKETRAVWLDKAQIKEGPEEIIRIIDALADANFNTIYVNTYFQGYVIYPGSSFIPQHKDFGGWDPLELIISEAHKRGMLVEAWTEYGFYCYYTPDASKDPYPGPILQQHPDWASVSADGTPYLHSKEWGDFYVLSPAHPDAQQFIINLFKEMVTRYDFDGIDVDRIRYATGDFCYSDYVRDRVKRELGFDPLEVRPKSGKYPVPDQISGTDTGSMSDFDPRFLEFVEWRKDRLTQFMADLSRTLRSVRPDLVITSAVVSPEVINEKGQDWPTWLKKGYLDTVSPMLYAADIATAVDNALILSGGHTMMFGISCDSNSPEVVKRQIEEAREKGASGFSLWYAHKVDDDLPLLKSTVFERKARPLQFRKPVKKSGLRRPL